MCVTVLRTLNPKIMETVETEAVLSDAALQEVFDVQLKIAVENLLKVVKTGENEAGKDLEQQAFLLAIAERAGVAEGIFTVVQRFRGFDPTVDPVKLGRQGCVRGVNTLTEYSVLVDKLVQGLRTYINEECEEFLIKKEEG